MVTKKIFIGFLALILLPAFSGGWHTPQDTQVLKEKEIDVASFLVEYDPVIDAMIQEVNETLVGGYIQTLQDFGPRVTGSAASTAASEYIFNEFSSLNLTVSYDYWTSGSYSDRNVEAVLPGTNLSSDQIFVVCGHFDSVPGSPGADDNAAGTAAAMAAAEIMSEYAFEHTIKFVGFSGEEQGLHGSSHYAGEASSNGDNIIAVLNADMIAWTGSPASGENVKIYENSASEWVTDIAVNISSTYMTNIGLTIVRPGTSSGSDHYPFWTNGFDAVFYHEYEFNPYYHSSNDVISNCNLTYDAIITRLIIATLAELAVPSGPREHDVGIESITHPVHNGTYPTGLLDINVTVQNYGVENQTGFNVSCEVIEIVEPLNMSTIFLDDIENGTGNWAITGDYLLWEAGIPSNVGPSSAHSPQNCWGTVIDGNYGQNEADEHLILSSTYIPPCDQVTLVFYTWYSMENGYDGGIIEVNNGSGWQQLDSDNSNNQYDRVLLTGYQNNLEGKWAFSGSSGDWEIKTFDLSQYINQTIEIRFYFGTDTGVNDYPGWYIDDVSLHRIYNSIETTVFTADELIQELLHQNDTLNVTWGYIFPNISTYRIITRTHLQGDQCPWNDEKEIRISMTNSQYSTPLYSGWNLLTIPVKTSWTAESLGENISGCTVVIRFDGGTQSFITHVVGTPYDDFPLEDGVGYFVYVTNDTSLAISSIPVVTATVQIYPSWNLIGWFNDGSTTAESLGSTIVNCTVVIIFDGETQTFSTHVVGTPHDDYTITKGMGLFIYTTAYSIWQGEG